MEQQTGLDSYFLLEREAREAVESLVGVKSVNIKMDAVVQNDGKARGILQLPIHNAIAIASGKGGVGKSTVAVNIAISLAAQNLTVGILDIDITGPTMKDRFPDIPERLSGLA
ncbi:MAG: Mrp/NBP35 family ATP-binding protein, partial [Alphaproteobacteria bacterium]|nr:Mrp/NBP35 family ATP-binding protein [Alphaproteobacteria bacterium]